MSTNLERRVHKLEGVSRNVDRKIHVIMLHQDRTLDEALADAGIEPKGADMVVSINTFADANHGRSARGGLDRDKGET
jgi:hypothetical protein